MEREHCRHCHYHCPTNALLSKAYVYIRNGGLVTEQPPTHLLMPVSDARRSEHVNTHPFSTPPPPSHTNAVPSLLVSICLLCKMALHEGKNSIWHSTLSPDQISLYTTKQHTLSYVPTLIYCGTGKTASSISLSISLSLSVNLISLRHSWSKPMSLAARQAETNNTTQHHIYKSTS